MTSRRCDHCGELYEPLTKRSRFCKTACRMAAMRRRQSGLPESVVADVVELTPPTSSTSGEPEPLPSLYAQTKTALEAADRLNTPDGVAALIAARRIDEGANGSAYRALHAAWMQSKAAALANASPKGGDIVDELAARRAGA